MPRVQVEHEGQTFTVEFPEGMAPEQMRKAIDEQFPAVASGTGSEVGDAAAGLGYGFNETLDATLNLIGAPIRAPINYAARQFGYEGDLIPELEAARRFNVAGVPDTTAGRAGQAVGEVAGGSVIPFAGMSAAASRMGASAPGALAQYATRPGTAATYDAASVAGAGAGVAYARENEAGPWGELALGLTGGFTAPGAANIAARRVAGMEAARDSVSQAMRRARDPEAAAYESVADRMVQSGIDPEEIRRNVVPQPSSALRTRGFDDADTADIVSRVMRGESADDVARSYGVAPGTVRRYIQQYRENNPTPRGVLDVAREVAGPGRSQPLSRLARSSYSIADEASAEAAERLLGRQETQAGRARGIVGRSVGDADFEETLRGGREALRREAAEAYDEFYREPALAIDQLSDLADDPTFKRAVRHAMSQARIEAIRHNQRAARTGQGETRPVFPEGTSPANNDVYTPEMLDYIQRQLRIMGEGFANDPNRARHARNLREIFLDRIEQHYPSFRGIRRRYATGQGEFGEEGALEAGRELVPRMGGRTAESLREFDGMTPAQQELFRIGFAQRLMDEVSNPQYGHQTVAKFNSPAFRDIVTRLFSGSREVRQRGERLLRDLQREALTTRTKNEVLSGSRTAELQSDMAGQMETARTAADFATGRVGRILENLANRLASQIGKRAAQEVLDVLTQTDPAEVVPILNRLARAARTQREARAYRDTIRNFNLLGFGQEARAGRRYGVELGTAIATGQGER